MSLFGSRDLALFLPDDDTPNNRNHDDGAAADSGDFKARIDKTKKILRHRPGQAPAWINQETEGSQSRQSIVEVNATVNAGSDSRLARLAAASNISTRVAKEDGNDVDPPRRRRVYEAEVIVDTEDIEDDDFEKSIMMGDNDIAKLLEGDDDDDDDNNNNKLEHYHDNDDDIAARRDRARRKLEEKRNDDLASSVILSKDRAPQVDSDSSGDEYTDESSEEEAVIMKPVFIPRDKRQTLTLAEARRIEDEAQQEKNRIAEEARKQQTRTQLAESIKRMDEAKDLDATDGDSDAGLPDDTDNLDDDMEFENWKLREILRLKRDSEEREKEALEQAEILRRRNMSDEERYEEDKRLGKFAEKEKKKWKFLQKYYHKGVFYMDDDTLNKDKSDVRNRDYSAPTLEDNYNKEVLPSVLQVKNFGKRGRTKYTHLVDQDTTFIEQRNRDKSLVKGEILLRPNEKLLNSYMSKRAGVGEIDTHRDSKKKKLE